MSFRVSAHVEIHPMHDEIVVLDTRRDLYFGLNGSAVVAWEILVAGGSVAAATSALVERFEVDEENAQMDVEALVGNLVARGLLETATP